MHVLPWLWPLADEDTLSMEVPVNSQADILRTLDGLCGVEDTPLASKVWFNACVTFAVICVAYSHVH